MSVSIQYFFQARKGDQWIDLPRDNEIYAYRYLQSWLGYGDWIKPIAKLRGFPPDFLIEHGIYHPIARLELHPLYKIKSLSSDPRYLEVIMGEFGSSWLLASEIINASKPIERLKIGIPIDIYNEWDHASNPECWEKAPSNWQELQYPKNCHWDTPENITQDTLWVVVDWDYDFTEDFNPFVDEVRRLQALHGEVRFVYGFL